MRADVRAHGRGLRAGGLSRAGDVSAAAVAAVVAVCGAEESQATQVIR